MRNIRLFLSTFRRKINEKSKKCGISIGSNIGDGVVFEGANYVGSGTFLQNCTIGYMSYFSTDCCFVNAEIGKYTSIGPCCKVVGGNHPTEKFVSTHPAFYSPVRTAGECYVRKKKFEEFLFAEEGKKIWVKIGNDVWIASNVIIMAGVNIEDGAVVAAGSIVTHDVPAYSVVGGVPARIIKHRFSNEERDWLCELKWWDKSEEWIIKHADAFEDISLLRETVRAEDDGIKS